VEKDLGYRKGGIHHHLVQVGRGRRAEVPRRWRPPSAALASQRPGRKGGPLGRDWRPAARGRSPRRHAAPSGPPGNDLGPQTHTQDNIWKFEKTEKNNYQCCGSESGPFPRIWIIKLFKQKNFQVLKLKLKWKLGTYLCLMGADWIYPWN